MEEVCDVEQYGYIGVMLLIVHGFILYYIHIIPIRRDDMLTCMSADYSVLNLENKFQFYHDA